MPQVINVLGNDPSLKNWGIAKGSLDLETNKLKIDGLFVVNPEVSTGKAVRQNSKDVEAATGLFAHVHHFMKDAKLSFVEVPHGSQSSRAMAGYGICCGVIGSLSCQYAPPIQVNAAEVKLAATGNKEATKKEMIQWAMDKHPEAPWPMNTRKGVTSVNESKAEHMADAIASIYAGMETAQYKQFRNAVLG